MAAQLIQEVINNPHVQKNNFSNFKNARSIFDWPNIWQCEGKKISDESNIRKNHVQPVQLSTTTGNEHL